MEKFDVLIFKNIFFKREVLTNLQRLLQIPIISF